MDLLFDWDEAKAVVNLKKHRISFLEAKTIFTDPFLLTILDEDHLVTEQRLISIGISAGGRILLVVHTDRNEVIRIISGRRATKAEVRTYERDI